VIAASVPEGAGDDHRTRSRNEIAADVAVRLR
jgi:hypothetical protein